MSDVTVCATCGKGEWAFDGANAHKICMCDYKGDIADGILAYCRRCKSFLEISLEADMGSYRLVSVTPCRCLSGDVSVMAERAKYAVDRLVDMTGGCGATS